MVEKQFQPKIRVTPNLLDILKALLESGDQETFASAITKRTNLHSGSVATHLHRLWSLGWVTLRNETAIERFQRQPAWGAARRYVKLTPQGKTAAAELLRAKGL